MDTFDRSFGLVIAFLLPGFIIIGGLAPLVPEFARWLAQDSTAPTFGGFSYAVLASLLSGLVISSMRWFVIDALWHRTGLERPEFDFSRLQGNLQAFELAVLHNYRHYQFNANSAMSGWAVAIAHLSAGNGWSARNWCGFLLLQAVLLTGSRDCLKRFYERVAQILRPVDDDRLFTDDD
jgi:hypothetical protein